MYAETAKIHNENESSTHEIEEKEMHSSFAQDLKLEKLWP
jgi:hypothetical protein